MTELGFTMNLTSSKEDLMNIITDYEKYKTYLPDQLKRKTFLVLFNYLFNYVIMIN